MSSEGFTILIDRREKKPYSFEPYPISTKEATLKTGDYTIEGHKNDFAVERKSKSDFLRSITHRRDNFEAEVQRAESMERPLLVVIESPYDDFRYGNYYADVHVNSVIGTIDKWQECYNVDFVFENDRSQAEERTYLRLTEWGYEVSMP